MDRYLLSFLFWTMLAAQSYGQGLPPTEACFIGDTLCWINQPNSCGPFMSTDIYFSEDRSGPYRLLIRDPIPGKINALIPRDTVGWFFIQYVHNCTVDLPPNSDTVTNLSVPEVDIEAVSVLEDGSVLVSWLPDGLEDIVDSFDILRVRGASGSFSIGQSGSFNFIDASGVGNDGPQIYFVQGFNNNRCGRRTGSFSDSHQTMFADASLDFCTQSATINWNAYQGWDAIDRTEIWIGIGSAPLAFFSDVPAGVETTTVDGIDPGQNLRIAVKAYEAGGSGESFSNAVDLASNVLNSVDFLEIQNVTVNGEDIDIFFRIDFLSDIIDLNLLRTNVSTGTTDTIEIDALSLFENNVLTDTSADITNQYIYQIVSSDQCENLVTSQEFPNLVLTGAASGSSFLLSWTDVNVDSVDVVEYTLFDDMGNTIVSIDTNIVNLVDTSNSATEFCFEVVAQIVKTGQNNPMSMRSNVFCIVPEYDYYVPNAFAPTGVNQIFKPEFAVPASLEECEIRIYDRWGGLLFSASCLNGRGWDGTTNGEDVDPGSYLYVISARPMNGEAVQKSGELVLLR